MRLAGVLTDATLGLGLGLLDHGGFHCRWCFRRKGLCGNRRLRRRRGLRSCLVFQECLDLRDQRLVRRRDPEGFFGGPAKSPSK